jgi:polyhydroxyalkanoate synthesis repressor PhaR
MRTIKRYGNRKLYDTQDSRYVTLDEIAGIIRGGDDVRVLSHDTQEDLTAATLAQIIFEEEKRAPKLPIEGLRRIIRNGLPLE